MDRITQTRLSSPSRRRSESDRDEMTTRHPSIIRDTSFSDPEHSPNGRLVRNIRQSMWNGWLVVCVGAALIGVALVVRELVRREEQGVY